MGMYLQIDRLDHCTMDLATQDVLSRSADGFSADIGNLPRVWGSERAEEENFGDLLKKKWLVFLEIVHIYWYLKIFRSFFISSDLSNKQSKLSGILIMAWGMMRFPFRLLASFALLFLASCSQQLGPSKSEIIENYEQSFRYKYARVKVSDFDIENTENLGTQTQPEIHTRYRATFKFDTSLAKDGEKALLKQAGVLDKEFLEIHGIAISQRSGEDWSTEFQTEKSTELIEDPLKY